MKQIKSHQSWAEINQLGNWVGGHISEWSKVHSLILSVAALGIGFGEGFDPKSQRSNIIGIDIKKTSLKIETK